MEGQIDPRPPALDPGRSFPSAHQLREQILFARVGASRVNGLQSNSIVADTRNGSALAGVVRCTCTFQWRTVIAISSRSSGLC